MINEQFLYVNQFTDYDWIDLAKEQGYAFLVIVKDLEDGVIFPVYFDDEKELEDYQNNIISETKVKVIKVIKL